MILPKLTYNLLLITAPKIHTDLLWDLSFLFIGLGALYFVAIFFYRNRLSANSAKVMKRKRELSPMISEFIFYDEDASKDEKSNYINLKIEIRQLIKNDFNRKVLSEVLLDLQKDVSGDTQKRLFKLYKDLNLHTYAFTKLKSWRWEAVSKAIRDLTQMQVTEAYGFITKFINDKRATIRKQAEIATVTLRHEGLNYFLDTTKHKISEWQQLKLLDVVRTQEDYQPPRFKAWLTSTNSNVVLFALRLIKFYNQNDANSSLIELVKHKNNQIKEEAIGCIKEFHAVEALDTLKTVFWKSTTDIKISILDAIAILGSEKDIEFLQLIQNKESNFYVKSKALSSINAISPERIMPTLGIQDTSKYQIPDDLPVANTEIAVDDQTDDSNSILVKDMESSANKDITNEESPSPIKVEVKEETEEKQMLEVGETDAISLEFLPIVVEKYGIDKTSNPIKTIEAINNLPITFEVVTPSVTSEPFKKPTKKSYRFNKNLSQRDFANEDLAFLPLVVANVQDDFTESLDVDNNLEKLEIHSIEVAFETVVTPQNEDINLTTSLTEFPIFARYNSPEILNLKVIAEEINNDLTNEQAINNIEVIEPDFLSFSIKDLKENTMDKESNASPQNLTLREEMNPKDEEKFRKIINDLIEFENKEEENEIIDGFQSSPLVEFENEFIDINFIPVMTNDDENSIKQENSADKEESEKKKKTQKESKQNTKAAIPKSILNDKALTPWVIENVNSEEATMQLLDDLSDLGDSRELPLLNEMLASERYVAVKERVKKLIERFSDYNVEPTQTKNIDEIALKSFNVFEDLFRTCDTEAKLILLDEIVAIGDKGDLEFLEGLLDDNDDKIQFKASMVLEQLRIKLAKISEDEVSKSTEKVVAKDIKKISKKTERGTEEQAAFEYTSLMEELEINPSPDPSDIFDLTFEITAENAVAKESDETNGSDDKTSRKTFMGQLCHLSHKIIEKLNG